MKRRNMFGLILLVIGVVFLLQAFDIIGDITILKGWWTLFLIVPALMSMSRTGVSAGNAILLTLGVGFLLREQGWNITQYMIPAIFIVLGVVILLKK